MQELRCDNRILFGTLEGRVLEVSCRSERCGKEPGVIIIHRFALQDNPSRDVHAGDLISTRKFRDPANRKEKANGSGRLPAVRSS